MKPASVDIPFGGAKGGVLSPRRDLDAVDRDPPQRRRTARMKDDDL